MHRRFFGGVLVTALLAVWAGELRAQETGTPVFKAPYRAFTSYEFGATLSDPGDAADFALEGFYNFGRDNNDFGIQAGMADGAGDLETRILLGADFRTRIFSYSESFPLDGALTVGFGTNMGDGPDLFYLPVGVSLGRRFELEGSKTSFTPYANPVIVPTFGGGDDDVNFALGLGVDMRFSDQWAVRASGGIGDIEGIGISLVYIR
jgi:Outer membrane protein beta-barrel domain